MVHACALNRMENANMDHVNRVAAVASNTLPSTSTSASVKEAQDERNKFIEKNPFSYSVGGPKSKDASKWKELGYSTLMTTCRSGFKKLWIGSSLELTEDLARTKTGNPLLVLKRVWAGGPKN